MADRFVVTRQELARLLGVTVDRITKLTGEGLPVLSIGGGRGQPTRFDLSAVLPWIWKRRTGGERDRYYEAQTTKVEQDIALRAGELVQADAVARRWAALVAACRERLLSLPDTALQRGVPATCEDVLLTLVDDALTELAERGTP